MLDFVKKEIDKFGRSLVKDTKRNLKIRKKISSGVLEDSIFYEVEPTNDGFNFEYYMVEYGYYQDEGVKGKNPSKIKNGKQKAPNSRFRFGSGKSKGSKGGLSKGLDAWIVRQRDLVPRDAKGRFMSRKTIKFLIGRSIWNQGIEPSMFFSDAWSKNTRKVDNQLAIAYVQDVEALFIKLIKQ